MEIIGHRFFLEGSFNSLDVANDRVIRNLELSALKRDSGSLFRGVIFLNLGID